MILNRLPDDSSFVDQISQAIKATIEALIEEEIERAQERLAERLKERAASIAIQLSKHFRVEAHSQSIIIEFMDRSKEGKP